MISPRQVKQSTVDQPTRQQLEELDALMQRILALPVNAVEDTISIPETSQRVTIHGLADVPPVRDTENAVPPPPQKIEEGRANNPSVARAARSEPSTGGEDQDLDFSAFAFPVTAFAAEGGTRRTATLPVAQPAEGESEKSAAGAGARAALTTVPLFAQATGRADVLIVSPWLRPFVWCNQAFDYGTVWLGPLGRWLRGFKGRALMGWTGILLIAAALAWVAVEGINWTW